MKGKQKLQPLYNYNIGVSNETKWDFVLQPFFSRANLCLVYLILRLQIIECRRVLKWTYAYGYYLSEEESTKKRFFEYLQGEAEVGLERLHHCAELEFKQLVKETEDFSKSFENFKRKLIGLTRVTKTYFENLVEALENGLADVEHNETKSATGSKRQKLV